MGGGTCMFNSEWEDSSCFPQYSSWVRRCTDDRYSAFCTICKNRFTVRTMGHCALKSHLEGSKHRRNAESLSALQPITVFTVSTPAAASESLTANSASTASPTPSPSASTPGMFNFNVSQDVANAELFWVLRMISHHDSYRSCQDIGDTLVKMFPGNPIAANFRLSYTKAAYNVTFGLAPFVQSQLVESVNSTDCPYVICFDEALNSVAQKQQLDMLVRYWNEEENMVSIRYLDSAFLGRSRASDILEAFKEKLGKLPINRLVQVSMDGPAVNWKFLSELQKDRESTGGVPSVLDLGSCGLHVIHGAFQFGHRKSEWNINGVLKAMYTIFKDSPARRAKFTEITGSTTFPKRFCAIRWVENVCVVERAVAILPNLRTYVDNVTPKPQIASFDTLKSALNDPALEAKLHFFKFVAAKLEPFLCKFQSNAPLSIFLAEEIDSLLRSLFKCVVKVDVVNKAAGFRELSKLDLTDETILLAPNKTEIGVAASRSVREKMTQEKLTQAQKLHFENQCNTFLKTAINKILLRSPLGYKLVRMLSSLSPVVICRNSSAAVVRFKQLVQDLFDAGWLSDRCADKSKEQFSKFCGNTSFLDKLKSFKSSDERVDVLYSSMLCGDSDYQDLFAVVKLALTLSHGNAQVEGGFSINESLLVENLSHKSIVAQRMVYDFIKAQGGLSNVSISPTMASFVKGSSRRYREYLECQRSEASKRKAEEQRLVKEKNDLEIKRLRLIEEKNREEEALDREIAQVSARIRQK